MTGYEQHRPFLDFDDSSFNDQPAGFLGTALKRSLQALSLLYYRGHTYPVGDQEDGHSTFR